MTEQTTLTRKRMSLEEQVCSLDLARRLKELGVKQESEFEWAQKWEWVEDSDVKERPTMLTLHYSSATARRPTP